MSQIFNQIIKTIYSKYNNFVPVTLVVRNMATVKRFYKRTNILSSGNKFEITLDQRKLKTPQGRIFEVNSEPLALAVAAEWDAQKEIIDRGSMHLTALCNTVLDNPHNHTKIDLVNHIVNCLEMDTVLFYSSEVDELYQLQIEKWEPIVCWFCKYYEVNIARTQSIETPTVSMETKTTLTRHLLSHNFNSVYGLVYAVDGLKSVILTLAVAAKLINIPEAVSLSRLEEEYQISHWGSVEWHHEYSKQDLQARLAAAMLFIYLNSHSATSRPKNDVPNIDLFERNLTNLPDEEQLALMRRTSGVFNTNSFEVMLVHGDCSVSLRGLYPLGALQNHCCVPNTRHHFDDQQRLYVSSALPIAAGEELTMSYTDMLWDTWSRRQFLRITKYFSCNCRRCSDPSEFGSRLAALLCAKENCSGLLLPRNPLNYESSWICNKCKTSVNSRQIECIHSGLKALVLEAMYKSPREIMKFVETTLSILIPFNNYIMIDVKYRIISYFGRSPDLTWKGKNFIHLTVAELRIKKAFCDDILSILDTLNSGDSIKKGLVLYELYRTNLELSKRHILEEQDEEMHPHMNNNDNEHLLQKAMSILQNDVGAAHVRRSD